MNFAHAVQPDPVEGRYRVKSEIDRVTIQVVQIEQLAASGQRDYPLHQTELIAYLRIGRQIRQIVAGILGFSVRVQRRLEVKMLAVPMKLPLSAEAVHHRQTGLIKPMRRTDR